MGRYINMCYCLFQTNYTLMKFPVCKLQHVKWNEWGSPRFIYQQWFHVNRPLRNSSWPAWLRSARNTRVSYDFARSQNDSQVMLTGLRTIRKWCSPAYNGYSFSRQMFMAKEDGGSRRAKRRSNTSGAWKSLRVLSPFNHIRFCGKAHMTDFQLKLYLIHIIIINHNARCRYKSQCTHSLLNFFRL